MNRPIAYLGPRGSYTDLAALQYFRHVLPYLDFFEKNSITQVFESIVSREADRGVVPSENLIDGTVGKTLDLLVRHNDDLRIVGEEIIRVNHCLAVLYKSTRDSCIEEIISHPKALEQCSDYLAQYYPEAKLIESASTSAAMQEVKRSGRSYAAAIGHVDAAKRNGLVIIDTAIQDNPNNFTTFYIISRGFVSKDANKTTISVEIPAERNSSGALSDILYPFKDLGINLSRIESRPTGRTRGEYRFFLDMDCSLREDRVRLAIHWIDELADVKILGSYRRAVMDDEVRE